MSASSSLPVSSRGKATRQRLLDGARKVFEEHGFIDTRVAQITKRAGVAYGSFYTHFDSKEEIFYEVASLLFAEMFAPEEPSATSPAAVTPRERLERANRIYWERYRRNARLMAIVEQVAGIDPEFARVRHGHRQTTYERMGGSIQHWQDLGLVPADLDPYTTAQAIGAMLDRTLYLRCVQGEGEADDGALDVLNKLTIRAVGLDREPGATD